MGEDFDLKIELAISRAFDRYIPKIIQECRKRDEHTVATCPAARLFNEDGKVELFRELEYNHKRGAKRQVLLISGVVTLLNGVMLVLLRHYL